MIWVRGRRLDRYGAPGSPWLYACAYPKESPTEAIRSIRSGLAVRGPAWRGRMQLELLPKPPCRLAPVHDPGKGPVVYQESPAALDPHRTQREPVADPQLLDQITVLKKLLELREKGVLAGVDCCGDKLRLRWPGPFPLEEPWVATSWQVARGIITVAERGKLVGK